MNVHEDNNAKPEVWHDARPWIDAEDPSLRQDLLAAYIARLSVSAYLVFSCLCSYMFHLVTDMQGTTHKVNLKEMRRETHRLKHPIRGSRWNKRRKMSCRTVYRQP